MLSWTVKVFIASGFNVNVHFQVISMHLLSPDVWTRVFYVIKLVVDQFFKRYMIQGINLLLILVQEGINNFLQNVHKK